MNLIARAKSIERTTAINLVIRGITLAGKFFLLLFLAKHLTTEQYGIWGIFTTSVALSLYLVGLDFYTYSSRTILQLPVGERSAQLRDQLLFYLMSYVTLFPLLSLLFVGHVMEPKLMLFFYVILVFEHLAQESFRTFVVFSKPIIANIILFLRTGSWAFILLIAWSLGAHNLETMKAVLFFWMGGGLAALITSIVMLSRFPFKPVRRIPVNWRWIWDGLKVSLFYFVGTVGYKIIEFSDRYFINYYHTSTDVGIYTFYANMANLIEIFVYTSVIIIFSPVLIESFHRNNYEYRMAHARFSKQVFWFNVLSAVLLGIGIIPILHVVKKPEYFNNLPTLAILAASEIVYNFSLIFHYILYVRKHDASIIKSTIAASVINILLNFILIPPFNIIGAAISTLLSYGIILVMKAYYSRNVPEGMQIIFFRFLKRRKPP